MYYHILLFINIISIIISYSCLPALTRSPLAFSNVWKANSITRITAEISDRKAKMSTAQGYLAMCSLRAFLRSLPSPRLELFWVSPIRRDSEYITSQITAREGSLELTWRFSLDSGEANANAKPLHQRIRHPSPWACRWPRSSSSFQV